MDELTTRMAGSGFLAGGGEMGARMRAHDWAALPVGPPPCWPPTLKATVRLMLTSRHPMFIWWGAALTCFYNDAYSAAIGPDRHPSALGRPGREVWAEIWPVIGPDIELVMRGQGATWHERQLVPITRGSTREDVWWTYGYSPIDDEAMASGVGGVLVICRDVTAEVQAEEGRQALARRQEELTREVEERTAELMAVEIALRQSQKMEAVGQLTGGIAHDFNNMLQAIGGSLEMIERRLEQGRGDAAARYVEGARATVVRAAALTHRLLAFARRQTLQPRPVEVGTLIKGMGELLHRTLGPAITVDLRLDDAPWPVLCDPNQLESVLLNLAINARDAMPGGGRLTIATAGRLAGAPELAGEQQVGPGDYVEIEVADSGIGMDEATQARAFEPFFTTKPMGQGTGLGLSQLYGFVRQSNGVVRLDSALGVGTTVRMYLPRVSL